MKVLFIDHGNIVRSQIAAAIYNNLQWNGSVAESYGVEVVQEGERNREGRLLSSYPQLSVELEIMKEKGLDISNNYSRQINQEALQGVSNIIIMSEYTVIPAWLKRHPNCTFWDVPVPPSISYENVCDSYDILWEKVRNLVPYKVETGKVKCSSCKSWNTQSVPGISFHCKNCGRSASTAWD